MNTKKQILDLQECYRILYNDDNKLSREQKRRISKQDRFSKSITNVRKNN